jgi:hypothetical protein
MPAQSSFKAMIHKIHTGEELQTDFRFRVQQQREQL